MKKEKIKGQIAYCENKDLKGLEHLKGGHYVYIRNVDDNGKCSVNVITSLETSPFNYNQEKLKHVRKGNTYAIPFYDSNFSKWSGVTKTPIDNVDLNALKNVGIKKIKRKHKFYIGKFCK